MRTGNAERACEPRGFLDKLLVGEAVKRTHVADFATIDDEAEYFGFAHRALHRSRRLTKLQREFPCLLQLREKRASQ
jgi:hypothetical protein